MGDNSKKVAKDGSKISRRTFLALTGGTGAGFMLKPQQKIVEKLIPYVNAPVYPRPGEWAHYLTTCRECPAGCGMMMWHRDGRVTKAEGNPESPINRGRLCIRGQSSVQGLYDNDRLTGVLKKNGDEGFSKTTWEEALAEIRKGLNTGGDVQLLSDLQTGSLAGVMEEFAAAHNQKPLYYEAFNYESMRRANQEMYGRPSIPRYDLSERDLIVSFGIDFLESWLSPVEYARQFGDLHTLKNGKMGKCIYLGPSESLTALNSDEFITISPGAEAQMIAELVRRIEKTRGAESTQVPFSFSSVLPDSLNRHLDKLAKELLQARRPLILAGRPGDKSDLGTMAVKAANSLNEMLGNNPAEGFIKQHALSHSALQAETERFIGSITPRTILIVHNANPVYTHPAWEAQLRKARMVIYMGTMLNETARLAHWVLPLNYSIEEWGDYEAHKGTISLMQPTMKPLFDTRSAGDVFLALGKNTIPPLYRDLVRENWRRWATGNSGEAESSSDGRAAYPAGEPDDKAFFGRLLSKGYISYTAEADEPVSYDEPSNSHTRSSQSLAEGQFFLHTSPSLFLYDGALANRGWLQEVPHPVTNIVWQSWVDMNAQQAHRLKIQEGDVLRISSGGASVEVAVRLTPAVSSDTLCLETGQGHTSIGKIANGRGVNAFELSGTINGSLPVCTIEKTGRSEALLYLNATKDQQHRELLQYEKLEKIVAGTAVSDEMNWPMAQGYTPERDLYKGHDHKNHRWGMIIDLQKCIGCKACEAACYAENNIPVVGKKNCREGREMSWLKVVPYHYADEARTGWLPVPCQHCDSAPCEPVCPVYASVHTEEGLNAQVYNRCIGTRYCSNNCPYKVRRFNWSNTPHEYPMTLQLNPEVTVRERGVMEKCTFCVQRIRNKQFQAKKENRKLTDGEIVPACVQTCPTSAIIFGDLMDENSEIRRVIASSDRRYQLLNELNTKTSVVYLKKVTI